MAKCFTSWTVLPHDPIEKHGSNLWSVSGKMQGGNQRRMTMARRADGTLVLHNPIALNDAGMAELEAWGKPSFIVVPNAFHRMDSLIYQQRYPRADVLCPQTARKKVSEVVKVSGHLDEMPKDAAVELFHLRGMKEREGALRVKSDGQSAVVFNDTVLNVEKKGGLGGFAMAPTGTLSVPRFMRWMMMKSGAELKAHLQELADSPQLSHVVPGHGEVIAGNAADALKTAISRF
jgi:hypothetical protein